MTSTTTQFPVPFVGAPARSIPLPVIGLPAHSASWGTCPNCHQSATSQMVGRFACTRCGRHEGDSRGGSWV